MVTEEESFLLNLYGLVLGRKIGKRKSNGESNQELSLVISL